MSAHRIECSVCCGHGYLIACRCGGRWCPDGGCAQVSCERCDGSGEVECEDDDCDVCYPHCTTCGGDYVGCSACGETGLAVEETAAGLMARAAQEAKP